MPDGAFPRVAAVTSLSWPKSGLTVQFHQSTLSLAGHSPSFSSVPFQLLGEGVTMSLDISTERKKVHSAARQSSFTLSEVQNLDRLLRWEEPKSS